MINEHCRIYKAICIYKFSAILKILKSARRSEAPFAVMSHLDPSLVRHPRFFLRLLQNGKPRSASEGPPQLNGGFLKNEAINCRKHKSNCQIEPMKITLPSYCEATWERLGLG